MHAPESDLLCFDQVAQVVLPRDRFEIKTEELAYVLEVGSPVDQEKAVCRSLEGK
jgi:hypothetical protein